MSNIGLPEIAIVLVIVLVIFGPKRLPQLGRSLGGGMREFKDAVTGKHKDEDEQVEIDPPAPTAQPVPQPGVDDQPAAQPAAKAAEQPAGAKAGEAS
jgi:sec-independent protein translocase protein TatA